MRASFSTKRIVYLLYILVFASYSFNASLRVPTVQTDTTDSSAFHPLQKGIPRRLIFVDTRYSSINELPRLVRENINNTIGIYSQYWKNETKPNIWFLGDEACYTVIQEQYPDLLSYYLSETFGPYKSDICRAAALHQRGGYYFDNDLEVVQAMTAMTPNVTFIMPTMRYNNEYFAPNTFIAATPRHVIIEKTLDVMYQNYRENRTTEEKIMGPINLWQGYVSASAGYCTTANSGCNASWSIFNLTQVNLEKNKELYSDIPRRKGWGCCCNYIIHNLELGQIYFWSRFLGSSGSCRFKGGKTADDID
jgi:hypothetical protein